MGRPRSKKVDKMLREATLAIFVESGLEGLKLDEVARRAGVSRTALYRRWTSREALLSDALADWRDQIDQPIVTQRDQPFGAMLQMLAHYVGAAFSNPFTRALLRQVLTLGPVGRPMLEQHLATIVAQRRAIFTTAIQAEQREGRIDPAIVPSIALDAVAGALTYALISGVADSPGFDGVEYTRSLFRTVGLWKTTLEPDLASPTL